MGGRRTHQETVPFLQNLGPAQGVTMWVERDLGHVGDRLREDAGGTKLRACATWMVLTVPFGVECEEEDEKPFFFQLLVLKGMGFSDLEALVPQYYPLCGSPQTTLEGTHGLRACRIPEGNRGQLCGSRDKNLLLPFLSFPTILLILHDAAHSKMAPRSH